MNYYISRLSQSSTNAPAATVIENNLPSGATVTYARTGAGVYTATFAGMGRLVSSTAQVEIPTTIYTGSATDDTEVSYSVAMSGTDVVVTITTKTAPSGTWGNADAVLSNTPFKVGFRLNPVA